MTCLQLKFLIHFSPVSHFYTPYIHRYKKQVSQKILQNSQKNVCIGIFLFRNITGCRTLSQMFSYEFPRLYKTASLQKTTRRLLYLVLCLKPFKLPFCFLLKYNYAMYAFRTLFPAGLYLLKCNNRNTITRCTICSKLTIKTREQCCARAASLQNTCKQLLLYFHILKSLSHLP